MTTDVFPHDGFPRTVEVHDSSAITHLAYDPSRKCLRVRFAQTASVWEYDHVWPSEFAQLVAAYSMGAAFNERIRNRKDARRIDPPASAPVRVEQAPTPRRREAR